jgi:plasmid stabilization system protein ParE
MRVSFNTPALADLREIFSYIAADDKNAAIMLIGRICEAVIRIGECPGIGQWTEGGKLKKLPIGNYSLFYEVKTEEIIIHHIRHGARLPPREDPERD